MDEFKLIFETSPLGIFISDKNGNYLNANTKALEQCGYSLEELKNLTVDKLIHPDNLEYGFEMFNKTLSEGSSKFDLMYIKKDGSIGWWRINGQVVEDKIIAYVEEVTAEKENYLLVLSNNDLYRSIIEFSFEGFWIVNSKAEIIDCNDSYMKKMGYSKSEIIGKKVHQIDALEKEEDTLKKLNYIREKKHIRFNSKHNTKYGFTLDVVITVSFNELNDLFYVFISESSTKEKDKEKYSELNTLMSLTLETANAGFWYQDMKNDYLFWDYSLRNIFEISFDEEVTKTSWLEFIHPHDRKRVESKLNRSIKENEIYKDEFKIITRGNNTKHIQSLVYYKKDSDDKIINYSGLFFDITQDINNILQLKEFNQRFRIAIESAKIGIWDYDYQNDYLLWNDFMYDIYDIDKDEFKNSIIDWEKTLVPEDLERTKKILFNAIENDVIYDTQFRIYKKNGSIAFIDAYGKLIKDDDGNPYKIYGVNIDITESVLEKNEIHLAKEKAEESDKLKSAFLQNISHEIRTPLNGIIGFTNLLVKESDPIERADYEKMIKRSSNRLIQVIDDIIDLSKVETGQLELNKTKFDIQGLIEDVCILYKDRIIDKGIYFECNYKLEESILIYNDSKLLIKVLSHLLLNAYKFTKEGKIVLDIYKGTNSITISISDTGIGISEQIKEKIFEKFVQGDNEVNRSYEGAGLGLSICKAYSNFMNAEIWFESQENVGTTFYLKIPLNEKQEESILIVEDNDTSFTFLKIFLKQFNYNIIRAFNGKEAIEKFENNNIILVLMDMKLPILNGYEATKIIREKNSNIPIFAVTADATDNLVKKAIDSGCNVHIPKPVDLRLLERKIKDFVK